MSRIIVTLFVILSEAQDLNRQQNRNCHTGHDSPLSETQN
jgi:hypothetical protein